MDDRRFDDLVRTAVTGCRRSILRALGLGLAAGTLSPWQAPAAQEQAQYTVVDLGAGSGDWSIARQITNKGQILGAWGTAIDASRNLAKDTRAVIWSNGSETDLTTLDMQRVIAINDVGTILGGSRDQGFL